MAFARRWVDGAASAALVVTIGSHMTTKPVLLLGLTLFPRREMGVDGIYVRPVPTDRNDLGEP